MYMFAPPPPGVFSVDHRAPAPAPHFRLVFPAARVRQRTSAALPA